MFKLILLSSAEALCDVIKEGWTPIGNYIERLGEEEAKELSAKLSVGGFVEKETREEGVMKAAIQPYLTPRWEITDLAVATFTRATGQQVLHLLLRTTGEDRPVNPAKDEGKALMQGEDFLFSCRDDDRHGKVRLLLWEWDDVNVKWMDADGHQPHLKVVEETADTHTYALHESYKSWAELMVRVEKNC